MSLFGFSTGALAVAPDAKRETVNLQDGRGMAKPYQVRQLLRLAARYNLGIEG